MTLEVSGTHDTTLRRQRRKGDPEKASGAFGKGQCGRVQPSDMPNGQDQGDNQYHP